MQEFFGVGGRPAGGDAQAERDLDASASDHDVAAGDVEPHALRQFPSFGGAAAGGDDEEFFSAAPADRVVRTDHGGDAGGDDAQDGVPGGVAASVVDGLEVVDVDHDEAHGELVALGAQQFTLENVEDGFAVPQAGQRVARGFAAQRVLGHKQTLPGHELARAGADEGKKHDQGGEPQALARDAQRHEEHEQRIEKIKDLGVDVLLPPRRLGGDFGGLSLFPGHGDHRGAYQQRAPQEIEPGAGAQAASGAVIEKCVDASGEAEKDAHAPEQSPHVCGTANHRAQKESAHDGSVTDEIRRPDGVRQLRGILRLGQIKEIEIGGDADQHRLYEIENNQSVEISGVAVGIEKHRHRQRREPEAEQEIGDPGDAGGNGEIVVKAESLGDHPGRVSESRQPPERAGETFGTAGRVQDGANQDAAERELDQIRPRWSGRPGAQSDDHTGVRQPQQAGQGHEDARTRQNTFPFRQRSYRRRSTDDRAGGNLNVTVRLRRGQRHLWAEHTRAEHTR